MLTYVLTILFASDAARRKSRRIHEFCAAVRTRLPSSMASKVFAALFALAAIGGFQEGDPVMATIFVMIAAILVSGRKAKPAVVFPDPTPVHVPVPVAVPLSAPVSAPVVSPVQTSNGFCAECGERAPCSEHLASAILSRGWCRWNLAEDASGNPVSTQSPDAVAWNLLGALDRAHNMASGRWKIHFDMLVRLIGDGNGDGQIGRWSSGATQEQAVAIAKDAERLVGSV